MATDFGVLECGVDCWCENQDECPFVELPDGKGWTTKALLEHSKEEVPEDH